MNSRTDRWNRTLQQLSRRQIAEIYDTHMIHDFPEDELRPLSEFTERLDRGIYECLGLFEDGSLRTYGFFVKDQEKQMVLLDFLAVCRSYRDCGYGSIFMELAADYYSNYRGILVECESECAAGDAEQLRVRSRRISFYLKNSCIRTRTKSLLFGVEFDILYLIIKSEMQCGEQCQKKQDLLQEVSRELEHIYSLMFGQDGYRKVTRVWNRHGRICRQWRWNSVPGKPVFREEVPSLLAALGFSDPEQMPKIVSFVGGGGKTTTMYQLADELAELGFRVLVTTSTHIRRPAEGCLVDISHVSQLKSEDWNGLILTAGTPDEASGGVKIRRPDGLGEPEWMSRLSAMTDFILIEADGAKEKPVKLPSEKEPVLVAQTGLIIACAGLSALGKTFQEGCFRFQDQGQWLRRAGTDRIGPEDLALILMDSRGSRKQVDGRYYRILLNQADEEKTRKEAEQIVRLLPLPMQGQSLMTCYTRDGRQL